MVETGSGHENIPSTFEDVPSSSVVPIFTFGRSSFGRWMTTVTAAGGGPAMCIVEWPTSRAASLHSGVS